MLNLVLSQFNSLLTACFSNLLTAFAKGWHLPSQLWFLLTWDTSVTVFYIMTQSLIPLILWKFSDAVFAEKSALRVW